MEFPRQPGPVKLTFEAEDQRDIEYYLGKLRAYIERQSYDNAVRSGNTITIYPHAVND